MPDRKVTEIRFDLNPPRPVGGTGDVVVPFGDNGQEVILKWEKGEIVDIVAPERSSLTLSRLRIEGELPIYDRPTPRIVTCVKCARDSTTGYQVCWDVKCLVR
jgi:hypothetical protein